MIAKDYRTSIGGLAVNRVMEETHFHVESPRFYTALHIVLTSQIFENYIAVKQLKI